MLSVPSEGTEIGTGQVAAGPMNVKIGPNSHAVGMLVTDSGHMDTVTGPAGCDGVMHSSCK
jgi:hypothetical protein